MCPSEEAAKRADAEVPSVMADLAGTRREPQSIEGTLDLAKSRLRATASVPQCTTLTVESPQPTTARASPKRSRPSGERLWGRTMPRDASAFPVPIALLDRCRVLVFCSLVPALAPSLSSLTKTRSWSVSNATSDPPPLRSSDLSYIWMPFMEADDLNDDLSKDGK